MNRRKAISAAGALLVAGVAGAGAWRAATGSMNDYDAYAAGLRAPVSTPPDIRDLVRFAALAPNGHNTQPWRFRCEPGRIGILPDPTRRTPVVDPEDHHLHVSLGCAAANLQIAGAATGLPGEVVFGEAGPAFVYGRGPVRDSPLFAAIPQRQSTRADYDGRPVPKDTLAALEAAAATPGVELALLTGARDIGALCDLIIIGNTRQINDPAFVAELKQWLRFSPRAAMQSGDGLFAAASGNPVLPDRAGRLVFESVFTAASENDRYARQMASTAGVAVFFADAQRPDGWFRVGLACQRFALAATARGLRCAFINQPVEVADLRAELASVAGAAGLRPNIVMRFGYGPTLPWSPRRPVAEVLEPLEARTAA